jgi:pimeloyl-ACP methyl ester carboxylesterase
LILVAELVQVSSMKPAVTHRAAPALRRAYFDCRHGQLHAYLAVPSGGGFDEKTAVFCVPGSAGTGSVFQPLLAQLGSDRSVYAPDAPGCGLSDAPAAGISAESHAGALLDLLRDLRLRRVHVLARDEGAAAALRLLELAPTLVATVVLWGRPTAIPASTAGAHVVTMAAASDAGQVLGQLARLFSD